MQVSPKKQNKFFIISFLPALVYWYLEENYPVHIAVGAGIALSFVEITVEKFMLKHVHSISKLNCFLIVTLGLFSLLGDDGIWFRLQPCIGSIVLAFFWAVSVFRKKGFLLELLPEDKVSLIGGHEVILKIEWQYVYFLIAYGLLMGILAIWFSTGTWLFFKTVGGYILTFILMIFQIVWLRGKIKKRLSSSILKP